MGAAVSTIIGLMIWEFLLRLFDPKGTPVVGQFIANMVGGALKFAIPLLDSFESAAMPVVRAFEQAFGRRAPEIRAIVGGPIAQATKTSFLEKDAALSKGGVSTPDNALSRAADAMGDAFGFGIGSHLATMAFESIFPEKLNTLNSLGPMLEKMAGFEEVSKAVIEPLYENAFGKGLEYHFRAKYKPELPAEPNAVRWHSQRLLSDKQLRALFQYSGLKEEYEPAFIASAYRAVQPRALATLFEDQEFPRDDVQKMLDFAGIRDIDQHVLLNAYEWNSTKNVRSQYLSSLLAAAEAGLLDQPTLDGHLDTLHFSRQAKNYVHSTIAIKRLEKQAALYLRSVSTLYSTGQLDDAQYVPALEAIGLARAEAEAHYGVDSARLKGKVMAQQEREAARLATQTQREGIQAIRAAYMNLP